MILIVWSNVHFHQRKTWERSSSPNADCNSQRVRCTSSCCCPLHPQTTHTDLISDFDYHNHVWSWTTGQTSAQRSFAWSHKTSAVAIGCRGIGDGTGVQVPDRWASKKAICWVLSVSHYRSPFCSSILINCSAVLLLLQDIRCWGRGGAAVQIGSLQTVGRTRSG